MVGHLEITLAQPKHGIRHIAYDDKIEAVAEDGTRIDISAMVRAHSMVSEHGAARMYRLEVFVTHPPTTVTVADDPGAFATSEVDVYPKGRDWVPSRDEVSS